MRFEIDLFGGLRELAPGARLELEWGDGNVTARSLKTRVAELLPADSAALLKASVLATEDRILQPDEVIRADGIAGVLRLALLPPVNGG